MSATALQAAQIYADVARAAAEAPRSGAASGIEKPNFGALVETAIAETGASLKAGEAAAQSVAVGDASLVDVVTAISAAEASLETAIAVRNKVIESYQEIMRMPI